MGREGRDRDRRWSAEEPAEESVADAPRKKEKRPGRDKAKRNRDGTVKTGEVPARSASTASTRSESPAAKASPRRRSPTPPPKEPVKFDHRRTSGEVWRCKKGKRSDIKPGEWDKFGYGWKKGKDEVLSRPISYDSQTLPIPRVKRKDITPELFYEKFACKHQPVIIEDVCDDWPAMRRWNIDALEERFRHIAFKVAKDDKGKKLRMKFKYYADYLRHQRDDSPLYLFETNVDDNGYIRALTSDYEVPDVFPHDWLGLVNNDSRPPFRWFCIGPKRSGTTVHTDPLGTAAWNAVTHGEKHWVLFEPKETKKRVKGRDLLKDGEDDEAIMYFDFLLPRIKRAYPDIKVYEGLQKPGEVIFVPGDWWHGVLNREDTVAVTQNYCGPDNFDVIWSKTRKEREKVAYLWLRNMKKFAPDLYKRAVEMNRRDGFRMRHERPSGERLSDVSSSSSESSSDSSSDEAVDLDPHGLDGVGVPPSVKLGAAGFQKQGAPPLPDMVSSARATFEKPGKRLRLDPELV